MIETHFISGNQEYACTRCPESFLHPNTLKAHIRFTCPRTSLEEKPRPSTLTPARPLELLRRPHISNIGQERKNTISTSDRSSDSVDDSFSAASAFRPLSVKHESPAPVSPENRGKPVSSPTVSTSRNTMRQSRIPAVSTSTEQTLPIPAVAPSTLPFGQAYNPISLAMEHAALRYYYPFYGRVAPEGHMCIADQPQSALVPQSAAAPVFHPAFCYPYGIPKPALPSDKPGMTAPRPLRDSHDGRRPEGPTLMSLAFPLPSESEGEPLDLLPRSLYMSKSRKGHLCIYCGKLYSRKYGLKIHLRTHTGYKPLQCKVCLRPFGDPSNLNKHIRLHAEGDTPYRCDFCGKVLVRRRDLERHIKSRHPSESLPNPGEACAAGSGTTEASDCGSEPTDQDSGGGSSHDGSDSDSDEIEVVSWCATVEHCVSSLCYNEITRPYDCVHMAFPWWVLKLSYCPNCRLHELLILQLLCYFNAVSQWKLVIKS